jgi:hypothetical protein
MQSKRKIFMERAELVEWRADYLVKMKQYREERPSIVC